MSLSQEDKKLIEDYVDGCCHLCDFFGEFKAEVFTRVCGTPITYTDNCMYRCDGCGLLAHRLCHSARSQMEIEDRIPIEYCHCQECGYKIEFGSPNGVLVEGDCKYFCDVKQLIMKMNGVAVPLLVIYSVQNLIDYVIDTDPSLRDDDGEIALSYNERMLLNDLFTMGKYVSNFSRITTTPSTPN